MKYLKILLLSGLMGFMTQQTFAQKEQLDKIVAIVGDKVILQSEINASMEDYRRDNPNLSDTVRCNVLEQYIGQKILAEQADRDSVIVTDEEVEGALENRIRYFINMSGSEEKLEETSGKTVYQLKDEYRPIFREQMIAQRMQMQVMQNVKITPQEVAVFYNKVPQDSLPFYPSMVEVGQIVFRPKINKEVEQYAIDKLEGIRKDILSGKSAFDIMAGIYSEDPGTRDNGGDLGLNGRDEFVAEFSAAAFRLQNGEISNVVKTKFGFHIIQMVSRQGEKARLRHILIKPLITSDMVGEATVRADSVRAKLVSGMMAFSEAVGKYTTDDATKITGGMFTDPQSGGSLVIPADLDPIVVLAIDGMKPGEFSQPQEFTDPQTGDKLVRILYLRNRTEPHRANLKDDYARIQQVAYAEKQNEYLMKWIESKVSTFYLKVDEEYQDCRNIQRWLRATAQANGKK
jgi:peptidyl-prolyl cis-trans isomerase SurA